MINKFREGFAVKFRFRASVMTGRYPISLGIQHDVFQSNNEECLPEYHVLMPEVTHAFLFCHKL